MWLLFTNKLWKIIEVFVHSITLPSFKCVSLSVIWTFSIYPLFFVAVITTWVINFWLVTKLCMSYCDMWAEVVFHDFLQKLRSCLFPAHHQTPYLYQVSCVCAAVRVNFTRGRRRWTIQEIKFDPFPIVHNMIISIEVQMTVMWISNVHTLT